MANNNGDKLISGMTARKYLKCNKERFEKLVEKCIRIMTGDFKRFRLKPTAEQGENFRQGTSYPLDTRNCIRNHAKVVIIDDEMAYIGSANVTPAGLGQGVRSPGSFEAGILTENPEIIASLNEHFTKLWNGDYCDGCHRASNCVEY